jgi:hypothetical protein
VTVPGNPESTAVDLKVHIGRLAFDPHRLIYGTIILMAAYALYDEGQDPFKRASLLELIGVTLAPLLALAMAHAFSDALDLQIRHGRRLTWHDRRHVAAENLEYLYVAVPPIILTVILALFGMDANDVVAIVQLLGTASLAFWGAYAARKAGLGGWMQTRFAVSYGFMGLIVIGVEQLLTH